MQFKIKSKKPVAKVVRPTLSAYATICDCADAAAIAEANEPSCEALDVEHSLLTLANAASAKEALDMLSASEKTELADALGASVESLGAMKMEDFTKKCIAALPVEPSQEFVVTELLMIIGIFGAFLSVITSIIQRGADMEKMELKAMWRQLEIAFKGKEKDALEQIVINGWGYKEADKALKAGEAILKFLKQDVKTVFDPKYKLADIEKMGTALWVCSTGFEDTKNQLWWDNWKEEIPEKKTGTLKELGYNETTIVSCSERCAELCAALLKFKELKKEAANALNEHNKENKLGFFAKIKRWWTETKDQRKEREQDELILTNKYYAIHQLLWGFRQTIIILGRSFYQAAVKADILVKKTKAA